MAKVGIDFGTTNSSVMFYDKGNGNFVSLLRKGDAESELSVTYAPSEVMVNKNHQIVCGWNISEAYHRSPRSSVIYNLKEKLLNDTENFKIFEFDKWELLKHFMQYLINNANNSPYLTVNNDRIKEVVLSVPVKVSTLYTTKLKDTVESSEYIDSTGNCYYLKVTALQEEPTAISLNLFASVNKYNGSTVLVCDFGGGTTDLAIVQNHLFNRKVLNHIGIKQAGNYIDDLIIKALLKKVNVSEKEFFSEENRALSRARYQIRTAVKEYIERDLAVPVELQLNDTCIYNDDLSKEEYYEIITPFIKQIISLANDLLKSHPVEHIILAGGTSNCQLFKELFEKEFPAISIDNSTIDKRTSTASGNAEWYQLSSLSTVKNILNASYGIKCYSPSEKRDYIAIFFHCNEELPIVDRCMSYKTYKSTDSVRFLFFIGQETNIQIEREYDFEKHQLLAGKEFVYQFGRKVPANTRLIAHFSMDENGIMTIQVESESAKIKLQKHTITGLK